MLVENYVPALMYLGIADGNRVWFAGAGLYPGPRFSKDDEKLSAYECGFEAFEDSRMKFDVRYYLVAILFIIFDLEIAFLFPWAVSLARRHRRVRRAGDGRLPAGARRRLYI